jgi:hypothetical protein
MPMLDKLSLGTIDALGAMFFAVVVGLVMHSALVGIAGAALAYWIAKR